MRNENLIVQNKRIKNGYTCKARILVGPRISVASLKEYKSELVKILELNLDNFELQKQIEYKLDMKLKCIVVHIVESYIDKVKKKLKKILND